MQPRDLPIADVEYQRGEPQIRSYSASIDSTALLGSYTVGWNISTETELEAYMNTMLVFRNEELAAAFLKKDVEGIAPADEAKISLIGDESKAYDRILSGRLRGAGVIWRCKEVYVHLTYLGGSAVSASALRRIAEPIQARLAEALNASCP